MARNDQLSLLPPSSLPESLRLDDRTRRIGLEGVARARAVLAEQARRRAERERSGSRGVAA